MANKINNLEFATAFTGELDKQLVQESVTGFMADSAFAAKFVGASQVKIPEMSMLALGDYDRDTGFAKGSVTVKSKIYELTQERGREFNIDREDMDETGVAGLAGSLMSEFQREKAIPEIDSYVISKIAAQALKNDPITTTDFNSDTAVYAAFDELLTRTRESLKGTNEELVCFITPRIMAKLRRSNEISRMINVGDFKQGEITRQVKNIDNVALIEVDPLRMYTAYESLSGAEGDEYEGGLKPLASASKINMLMVGKKTASLIKKLVKIKTFTADENQEMDAYKFQYRIYYDLLIKASKAGIPHIYYEPTV